MMNNIYPYPQLQPVQQSTVLSQAQFMRQYNDSHREQFNDALFERNDDDIIAAVEDVILSCERDKYFTLKVLSFRVVKEYEDVQRVLWEYEDNKAKSKGKKIDNPYDYIDLRDSDIMILMVRYHIKVNRPADQIRIDSKTGKPEETERDLTVLITLPRFVNKYYFRISGNYYSAIYQIVDGSTYNNSAATSKKTQSVTLKTMFMPIRIYRESEDLLDHASGEHIKSNIYSSIIFSKKVDAMLYILGRYGYYGAAEMLGIENVLILKEPMEDSRWYSFKKDEVYVAVPKMLFDRDHMVQSFVYTIWHNIIKGIPYEELFDPRYWNKCLGKGFKKYSIEKGIPVLDSLEGIYDIATKHAIRLPKEDKETVYHILRWMMREFPALRLKDNLDISTKKIRIPDYMAALYAMKISRGIYRVSDEGKNVRLETIVRAIATSPNYIISQINKCKLVNYVDLVNDNDAVTALAYTYKGISGLGDQGAGSAIPKAYRGVHPSHLGRLDLDSSSNSDPGLSGTLCPMVELDGDSFSDYQEPNSWEEEYNQLLGEFKNLIGMDEAIQFKKKLGLSFDYIKEDLVRETISTYQKLVCPVVDMNGIIDYSVNSSMEVIRGNDGTGLGDIEIEEEDLPSTIAPF